jgi:hypothetical protein
MEAVLPPVFHRYETPPEAVITALAPIQIIPSLTVTPELSATDTDGVGNANTVTVVEAVEVSPNESVAVTV